MASKARTLTLLLFAAALLLLLPLACRADDDEVLAEAPQVPDEPNLNLSYKVSGFDYKSLRCQR